MHRTKERISVNKKVKIMVNTRSLCKSKNIVEATNFGQISKYWQKVELYGIFGENISIFVKNKKLSQNNFSLKLEILIEMEIMTKNSKFNSHGPKVISAPGTRMVLSGPSTFNLDFRI